MKLESVVATKVLSLLCTNAYLGGACRLNMNPRT